LNQIYKTNEEVKNNQAGPLIQIEEDNLEEIKENDDIDHSVNLSQFLTEQEVKVDIEKKEISSSIKLLPSDSFQNVSETSDQVSDLNSYTVKTIKVNWEENKNAYLHVFINTTSISKLEEEKAKNKCMQIMFSSVSHEFRTPLNAFTNSLALIEMNVDKVKTQIGNLK
jgi:signal transduction histidine kinase